MLLKTSTALAILAAASQVVAEPQPYAARKLMSVRDMFGVVRRDGADSYTPSQSYCGIGETCAQACGAGYETCSSTDDAIHCYDPSNQQVCCPDGSGNSCDAGYYCSGTEKGETVCCPNSQSLAECAAAYHVKGSLTRETAKPTSSSASSSIISSSSVSSSSSSSSVNSTTSTAATKPTGHHGHHANGTVVTSYSTSFTTTSCLTSTAGTAAPTNANNFTTSHGGPSPTASQVATSAGGFIKPAGAAAAILAAVFTFLL
ncbi:hypothetical protein HMPREF1624_00902 [Sporothrix schenckii ATCC 58251]|uniref:Prp 4 CRoW domain-containing protein n=2 Tax=Sporothrix schenckii TaxID=29908 RepID=U7Q794_SPOS1|nr:hypothetical protein HMPREF1624_00902 [Sporothrix schenckii ATCC 58251]